MGVMSAGTLYGRCSIISSGLMASRSALEFTMSTTHTTSPAIPRILPSGLSSFYATRCNLNENWKSDFPLDISVTCYVPYCCNVIQACSKVCSSHQQLIETHRSNQPDSDPNAFMHLPHPNPKPYCPYQNYNMGNCMIGSSNTICSNHHDNS